MANTSMEQMRAVNQTKLEDIDDIYQTRSSILHSAYKEVKTTSFV
jgi:hypothetical protein